VPRPLFRRALRLLAAVALVASAFATVGTAPARADTTTTMTATPGATGEVTLRWAAPSGVTQWVVVAKRASDGQRLAMQTVCGTCTTATLRHLTPGVAYRFAIGGVGRPGGTVWGAVNLTLPADPLCGTSESCIAVDAMTSTGAATGVGRGLLMGLTTRTDQSRVADVGLGYHRIDALNAAQFTAARKAGGAIDVVISAAWTTYTRNTLGRQMNPWEDWRLYRSVVANTVWWHLQQGLVPDYWEIQNEPDQAAWYKTSTPGMEPTTARILEQFRVAHDTIRSVLPTAKIVGPSIGIVDPPPKPLLDLPTFLDYVVAKGLTFDVIAWHELTGSCGGGCDLGPRSVAQHVAAVRQMIALRPALGMPELHVNEFGGPGNIYQAGATVGYFDSLVAGGVDRAGSACWPAAYEGRAFDGCYNDPGTMDNILMPDGRTPTANWYVWEAYADMAGQHQRMVGQHAVFAAVEYQRTGDRPQRAVERRQRRDEERVGVGQHRREARAGVGDAPVGRPVEEHGLREGEPADRGRPDPGAQSASPATRPGRPSCVAARRGSTPRSRRGREG